LLPGPLSFSSGRLSSSRPKPKGTSPMPSPRVIGRMGPPCRT
jgi:hypothetical protein